MELSLNAVRDGYPSYERCHADKEECEGVSDDAVEDGAVSHVSIVTYVGGRSQTGGTRNYAFLSSPHLPGFGLCRWSV